MRLPASNFPYDVASDGRFLMDTLDTPSADPSAGMTVVVELDGPLNLLRTGRFGGIAGVAEFTELRWITVATEPGHFPI